MKETKELNQRLVVIFVVVVLVLIFTVFIYLSEFTGRVISNEKGEILYYKFEKNVKDSGGNSNHWINNGAVSVNGIIGQALAFDIGF